ncbi:hypothetical protein KBB68_01230 [Candidatus Babeliales bacterium]|nr:hypothetical protein [Candidatus Babeliales bacterium]
MKKSQNFLRSFMYGLFFYASLHASQGNFTVLSHKPSLKISVRSKFFLKDLVLLQQNYLNQYQHCISEKMPQCLQIVQLMLELNQEILQSQEISSSVQSRLFSIVNLARQTLFEQQAPTFCDLRDQVFKLWWNFLERSLDHVQVQGYQQDFVWLCSQVGQLAYAYKFSTDINQFKKTTIHCVTMCQDLMHKFNGLFVNDYDLLVLGNVAVVLLAMRC